MSLDLKTLRKGDVVRGVGTFDGSAIRWDAARYDLVSREFRAGDPVSWRERGAVRRGSVLAVAPDEVAQRGFAWVAPYLGNPVTVPTADLSHDHLPRRDEVEEAIAPAEPPPRAPPPAHDH